MDLPKTAAELNALVRYYAKNPHSSETRGSAEIQKALEDAFAAGKARPTSEPANGKLPPALLAVDTLVTFLGRDQERSAGVSVELGGIGRIVSVDHTDARMPYLVRWYESANYTEHEQWMYTSEVGLTSTQLDVRPEVAAFALLMEAQLRKNDHKGGWADCDLDYLLRRLGEEVAEVNALGGDTNNPEQWGAEAADIANFAMMIADNAGALKGKS